jgi:hypothetical protein
LIDQLRVYYIPDSEKGEEDLDFGEMYSNTALLQRESLKFDPKVKALLDKIWQITDNNHNGSVDKDEYVTISKKLYYALVDHDPEEATKIAEEEWELDSFGLGKMDKTRFVQSWFQLTDTWTDSINKQEYVDFLDGVLKCLATEDENGQVGHACCGHAC